MGYLDIQSQFRQREKVKMEWRPWLMWVAATGVGYTAGSYLIGLISLAGPAVSDLPSFWVRGILSLAVAGAMVGLAQGLVLWKYLQVPILRPWVLATAIGSNLGVGAIFLFRFVPFMSCIPLSFIIPGALLGALVGYAQRVVLERYLNVSTWWVRLNVLAGILAFLPFYAGVFWATTSFTTNRSVDVPNTWATFAWIVGWLPQFIYGAVTGWEFLWIEQRYRAQR